MSASGADEFGHLKFLSHSELCQVIDLIHELLAYRGVPVPLESPVLIKMLEEAKVRFVAMDYLSQNMLFNIADWCAREHISVLETMSLIKRDVPICTKNLR